MGDPKPAQKKKINKKKTDPKLRPEHVELEEIPWLNPTGITTPRGTHDEVHVADGVTPVIDHTSGSNCIVDEDRRVEDSLEKGIDGQEVTTVDPVAKAKDAVQGDVAEGLLGDSDCESKTLGDEDSCDESSRSVTWKSQVHQEPKQQGEGSVGKVFDEKLEPRIDPNKSWRDRVFGNNRKPEDVLKLEEVGIFDEVLSLEEDDMDPVDDKWPFALIGYLAGRNTGKIAIVHCCDSWKVPYQIQFHDSGWVIVKFGHEVDRDKVLENGPYMIYGRAFMVKVMPELFNFNAQERTKVPVWVRLPNLPTELWNARALSKIASKIGKPIRMDKLTQTKHKVSYARVLVEVDISKELIRNVRGNTPKGCLDQHVIYEYEPKYCKECKAMGHDLDSCPKSMPPPRKKVPTRVNPTFKRFVVEEGVDGAMAKELGTQFVSEVVEDGCNHDVEVEDHEYPDPRTLPFPVPGDSVSLNPPKHPNLGKPPSGKPLHPTSRARDISRTPLPSQAIPNPSSQANPNPPLQANPIPLASRKEAVHVVVEKEVPWERAGRRNKGKASRPPKF